MYLFDPFFYPLWFIELLRTFHDTCYFRDRTDKATNWAWTRS